MQFEHKIDGKKYNVEVVKKANKNTKQNHVGYYLKDKRNTKAISSNWYKERFSR